MNKAGSARRTHARPVFPWAKILRDLSDFYSSGDWRVPVLRERGADPFGVLTSTIISHRARDEATLRAYSALVSRFPTPESLSRASPQAVENLIRPAGLTESKARGLIQLSKAIVGAHGGEVPRDYKALLTLPNVGPKTANAVLVFGWKRPAIPVDSHIHRVVNRLGVVKTRTPERTTVELQKRVPRRFWPYLNPVLVQHGQNVCRVIDPRCEGCPILRYCHFGREIVPVRSAESSQPKGGSRDYVRDGRAPIPRLEVTSRVMSANRGKGTSPEVRLTQSLRARRVSGFRLNWRGAPGHPDIAFPGRKFAIFVNGCFWHRCPRCHLPLPKTHTDYWRAKFERNAARDARKLRELEMAGWKTMVVWECEIRQDPTACAERIEVGLA